MIRRCVLGYDISYSLSPVLHAALSRVRGEDASYTIEDVAPEDLDKALPRLLAEYDGFNVTKPYKMRVAAYLGETQPVNTVRCADRRATSTDPIGFLRDYTRAFGTPRGRILLLGAGGAATSVALALHGVSDVHVHVYNRTYAHAETLAQICGFTAVRVPQSRYDVVINATSAGLHGEDAAAGIDLAGVKFAYDLVYAPPVTPFTAKAEAAGARVCGGLGMLIYQAIAAREFWTGETYDEAAIAALYAAAHETLTATLKKR